MCVCCMAPVRFSGGDMVPSAAEISIEQVSSFSSKCTKRGSENWENILLRWLNQRKWFTKPQIPNLNVCIPQCKRNVENTFSSLELYCAIRSRWRAIIGPLLQDQAPAYWAVQPPPWAVLKLLHQTGPPHWAVPVNLLIGPSSSVQTSLPYISSLGSAWPAHWARQQCSNFFTRHLLIGKLIGKLDQTPVQTFLNILGR